MVLHHHASCLIALALSLSACSVTHSQPRLLSGDVQCAGGSIQSATDMARFTGCQTIRGGLAIVGSNLESLDALRTLRSVSGTLTIADNPDLSDLHGLSRLAWVGELEIRNNQELWSLAGLEGLTRLGRLTLDHTGLYSTSGLDNVRQIDELEVTNNARLIDLGGLSGVVNARSVRIEQNPRLCGKLGLLSDLERVEGELKVEDNVGLSFSDVAALEARVRRPAAGEALLSALPTTGFGK